jgi:hypothetical protein
MCDLTNPLTEVNNADAWQADDEIEALQRERERYEEMEVIELERERAQSLERELEKL